MKTQIVLLALFAALMTMGPSCIREDFVIAVEIGGLTGTYAINPGSGTTFGPPTHCKAIMPSSYLSGDVGDIKNVRVYDIRVRTVGQASGLDIINGRILVDGTPILSYSGSWNAFNTPQSLLTSTLIQRNTLAPGVLVSALKGRGTVELCGAGSLSRAITETGLALKIEVLAQVDATLGGGD